MTRTLAGDPIAADYDGDGAADIAVYDPAAAVWRILTSASGYLASVEIACGGVGWTAVPGDVDGDVLTGPIAARSVGRQRRIVCGRELAASSIGRARRRNSGSRAETLTEVHMTTESIDPRNHADASGACAVDAVRRAAHVAHEVSLLKTMAADAAETGRHAVTRAITRGRRDLEDLRESAAYRVKRAPLVAVGVAFAAGMLAAALSAQCVRALRVRARPKEW